MKRQILAGVLSAITVFGLMGCGNVEKKSSNGKAAAPADTESSSFVETVKMPDEISTIDETESSSYTETEKESEESSEDEKETDEAADDSSQQESIPEILGVTSDDTAFYEMFPEKIYACEYDTAVGFLKSVLGDTDKLTELGEFRNALGKIYLSNKFDYTDGVSVLGENLYNMTVDYDYDDNTVYTVGFHKNPDLNTSEDYDPSAYDCKESYDRLYAQFTELYGEPATIFTPEEYGYYGALWNDTTCGEIWIAWGDEVFGSRQADCIISFSRKGISGTS